MSIKANFPIVSPSIVMDFANSKTLDPRITFTRTTTGTCVGSDGLIKTAGVNEARFDHDPDTGESLGLLIEEDRTNIIDSNTTSYSSIWSNSVPTGANNNAGIAPDGTNTAFATTAYGGIRGQKNYSITSDTNDYTFSIFIKSTGGQGIYSTYLTGFHTGNQDSLSQTAYDFATDTVGSGYSRKLYANGWVRIWKTYANTNKSLFIASNGIGTSLDMLFWGAQLEQGSYPSSLIITPDGANVTRAVDTAVIEGTNFTDWYSSSASTLFMEGKLSGAISSGQFPFVAFEVESNNNRNSSFAITRRSGQGVRAVNYDSSGTQDVDITNSTSWDGGTYRKFAFALDNSGSSSVLVDDGTVIGTNSSYATTSLSSVDILRFADHNSGGMTNFNVTIKRLTYYPQRLSNSQLQNLTK